MHPMEFRDPLFPSIPTHPSTGPTPGKTALTHGWPYAQQDAPDGIPGSLVPSIPRKKCTQWNSGIPCSQHPHISLNRTATGKNRTRPRVALNAASNDAPNGIRTSLVPSIPTHPSTGSPPGKTALAHGWPYAQQGM
ncbi:hypothetical protein B0H14DRAFT_2612397 [Mycena olivaceomarginata]|nr:hypothetical protein B0H14DRAFT_2612397 [Mycena olivaceomarginata]